MSYPYIFISICFIFLHITIGILIHYSASVCPSVSVSLSQCLISLSYPACVGHLQWSSRHDWTHYRRDPGTRWSCDWPGLTDVWPARLSRQTRCVSVGGDRVARPMTTASERTHRSHHWPCGTAHCHGGPTCPCWASTDPLRSLMIAALSTVNHSHHHHHHHQQQQQQQQRQQQHHVAVMTLLLRPMVVDLTAAVICPCTPVAPVEATSTLLMTCHLDTVQHQPINQPINQNTCIQRHMLRTNQRRITAETRLSVHIYYRQYQTLRFQNYA